MKFIALLRGINVGGKNKLPMKELCTLFAERGCRNVRSYIQSGNVLFETDSPEGLSESLGAEIEEKFGLRVPVVIRSISELERVAKNNPFLSEGAPEDQLHVMFLADLPKEEQIQKLDPDFSLPDRFAVAGSVVYLWLPNGVARSKLTNAYFDSKLKTVSTSRNWRTVLTIFRLAQG